MKVRIECGEHRGVVTAKTVGEAWRKLTKGKTKGFAVLARYRARGRVWLYTTPWALDVRR